MLKMFLLLSLLAQIHFSTNGFSYEKELTISIEKKMSVKNFVRADQVEILPEGIFICVEGEYIPVQGIIYDHGEFYYLSADDETCWICPACRTLNSFDWANCVNCGHPQ